MANAKREALRKTNILLHSQHVGCSFWESPDHTILVVFNPSVIDLVKQAEDIVKLGYKLKGGIQLIRRDDGDFNGWATFVVPADQPAVK